MPHNTYEPPSLERPKLSQLEVEPVQTAPVQSIRDALDNTSIDTADETDRQVQVGGGRPPESRRRLRARREESAEGRPLRLGQRQSEERPNARLGRYFRAGAFFQWAGTHELGAVGRQPKCVLTESMPSATLAS